MVFKTKLISSLEKVFPNDELRAENFQHTSALIGENIEFQLAVWAENLAHNVSVEIASEISDHIEIGSVGLVPSMLPNYADHDAYLLKTEAGLYPDPIFAGKKCICLRDSGTVSGSAFKQKIYRLVTMKFRSVSFMMTRQLEWKYLQWNC